MNHRSLPSHLILLVLTTLGLSLFPGSATSQEPLSERDQAFADKLIGAKLEGRFNVSSASGTSEAQVDNYAVSELERGPDNTWIFNYTMSYGQGPDGPKITVPIPVKVEWAGDTPMLTMTEQTIEGMGTFSVRILIYKDWYAGTWDNGSLGGHMWGQIVKEESQKE